MIIKYSCFLLLALVPAMATDDYTLFKQARTSWFDNDWEKAAVAYKAIVDQYPDSKWRCKSENYLAYCYKNMNKTREAFDAFTNSIASGHCNEEAIVDARSERVSLAATLLKNDASMLKILKSALNDPNKDIRFLAAVKLAGIGNTDGIEVFFEVVEEWTDQDLRELAMNHILKLGNAAQKERLQKILEKYKEANKDRKAKMIRLIIRDIETNKIETRVNVPLGLAQAVLAMLTEDQVALIKNEANLDLSNLSSLDISDMAPGTVLFKVVDSTKKEIKLFLE